MDEMAVRYQGGCGKNLLITLAAYGIHTLGKAIAWVVVFAWVKVEEACEKIMG